jgi:hypothetical protein
MLSGKGLGRSLPYLPSIPARFDNKWLPSVLALAKSDLMFMQQ